MTDICDHAAQASEEYLADAIRNARARSEPNGPSATNCENCAAIIPAARQRILPGVRLCVQCQAEEEKYGAR